MTNNLERYAAIGDTETLALVGDTGGIEWFCWPRFDSPSVFGSLLDPDGGHWTITADDVVARRQVYLSQTNVVVTRLHTTSGIVEIEDCMAIGTDARALLRTVTCRRGSAAVHMTFEARPDYGRRACSVELDDLGATIDLGDGTALQLVSSAPLGLDDSVVTAAFDLTEGETVRYALGPDEITDIGAAVDDTIDYWQAWAEQSTYRGRWREAVGRSSLALKLLTHAPSGGLIAAGTTSLPEVLGGERNWDYRYVWIRDAAFTLYAFLELGYRDEADAFVGWLTARLGETADRCRDDPESPPLSPLYDLDGNSDLDEQILDHWRGYEDSAPVRIGNAASDQVQLDIYGELIDSLYLADKQGDGLSVEAWNHIRTIVDWLVDHWEMPDAGMWEARTDPQRYTSSLLMCWVAVERAMRMATFRGRPAELDRWRRARDAMHDTLMSRGVNDGVFTQTLDGTALDASMLLAPLVKVIAPTDPVWLATLDAIGERLAHGPLVDRYDLTDTDDGLAGGEGSFTICSFWYVEALAMAGRSREAQMLFDRLLSYASPTGLFSEEIGTNGRLLGNMPQAFTHLALISAAVRLDELLPD